MNLNFLHRPLLLIPHRQANALRNQLRNIFESNYYENQNLQALDNQYEDVDDDGEAYFDEGKRSLSAMARGGMLPTRSVAQDTGADKRNIGSMARMGMLRTASPAEAKRSIATLAKNGQLPSREPETEDSAENSFYDYKRNLASIARQGGAGKRNIAALARDYELPSYGKRNLPSILRTSGRNPKRNVATLARDNLLPYYSRQEKRENQIEDNKRNIGSMKNSPVHGSKVKRDIGYDDFPDDSEILTPNYQTAPLNYDELRFAMNELYPSYENEIIHDDEKRYLGKYWLSIQNRLLDNSF